MNDLQKKQLEILKAFIKVCEKYNLKYFLVGGSCIGAIRHHGFIPWDDDVDVGMPRPDYDKFMTLQKEYEGTPYFIQNWKSDKNYCYNFAKLRDSSTTFIENYWANTRMNHGVWVDIFPIDGMSYNDIIPAKKFKRLVSRNWWNVYMSYFSSMKRKFHKATFFKDLWCNFLGVVFWPLNIGKWRQKHNEKKAKKIPFEKSILAGNLFGTNPKKEAMKKEIFTEFVQVPFEDIMVSVPKDYDSYLKNLFGDYMKLPPENQRVGHHHDKGLSLTQGYQEYIKEHKL